MLPIVPRPVEATLLDGAPSVLTSQSRLVTGPSAEEVGAGVLLANLVGALIDRSISVARLDEEPPRPGDLVLRIDESAGPEGATSTERYTFDSRDGVVEIVAASVDGLVRGMATLGQLLEPVVGGYSAPAARVVDAPRFAWRGLSLDVARHFFGVEDVKRVLQLMARLKLNVLHLHLTDDQGWRLEIPSRPELTRLGSTTSVGGGPGGFFSVEDFAELQTFAHARGITVIPEIDLPGHTNAALHACPELNADGEPKPVYTGIEVGFSSLDASLPATERFLRDVLGDVAAMTRGPWVHLGGDEAHDTSPEDYAAIVRLAAEILREHGKVPVGWQEAAGVPGTAQVVQVWHTGIPLEPLAAAAASGVQVVMSPAEHAYLDMKYHEGFPLGLEWAGFVELRDSYEWEPTEVVPGLDPDAVVGVEAAVWTETLTTLDELTTMLLPRLTAVAEAAWSARERRDWDSYAERVRGLWPRWERLGFSWHPSPQVDWAGR